MNLTQAIKHKALELGFELVNVIPVAPSTTINIYAQWLALGYSGTMAYLEKHFEKKQDLRKVMPQTLSLVSLAMNYHTISIPEEEKSNPSKGVLSSYAWGEDYHQVIREKLEQLRTYIETTSPHQEDSRVYVDTGPILEREYAQHAGLGWLGKNSMLINWEKGSWFFLAEILLDIELEYNAAIPLGDCGNCTRCLDACPTKAIVSDRQVDARRCLSYLTIELKETIPQEFRPAMGNLIFGCDICQEVCPWNRKAPISQEPGFQPKKKQSHARSNRFNVFEPGGIQSTFQKQSCQTCQETRFFAQCGDCFGELGRFTSDSGFNARVIRQRIFSQKPCCLGFGTNRPS